MRCLYPKCNFFCYWFWCEIWPGHDNPICAQQSALSEFFFTLRWSHDCAIIAGKEKGYFPSLFFFPCASWRLIFLQRRLQWVGWAEGSALTELCRRLCSGNPNPQWPLTSATAATSAPERERKREKGREKEREKDTEVQWGWWGKEMRKSKWTIHGEGEKQ